jgi:hypothetical protein
MRRDKLLTMLVVSSLAVGGVGCSAGGGTTEPDDAGTTPVDTGRRDTGVLVDRGVTDTGVTQPDVGPGPFDVGPVPTDGGTGPTDSGTTATCGMLGVCNIVANTGCAVGEGCYGARMAPGDPVTGVCAMAGRRGWGERCTAANDCREGFACLGTPGTCTKLCCGTDNASCRDETRGGRAGALCAGTINDIANVRYCIEATGCDLYATSNNRCPSDRPRCDAISADGTTNCFAQTAGVTPGMDGTPCCNNQRCAPGFVCVGFSSTTCDTAMPNRNCRRVCNPDTEGTDAGVVCPSGQFCGARFNNLPETYGACVPMMMM